MNKKELLNKIQKLLEQDFHILATAAHDAKEAATNEESKAENKYDTRGLEASYLAGAQAKRAEDLKRHITIISKMEPRSFSQNDPIDSTALVTVDVDGETRKTFFILPFKGGLKVQIENTEIHTLSVESPLGKLMMGLKLGDDFEFRRGDALREYEIIDVK